MPKSIGYMCGGDAVGNRGPPLWFTALPLRAVEAFGASMQGDHFLISTPPRVSGTCWRSHAKRELAQHEDLAQMLSIGASKICVPYICQ